MKHRLLLSLVLWAGMACLQLAQAGPHIYYDDNDNIKWKMKISEAIFLAKLNNRPLFVHMCKPNHKASEEQVVALLRDEKLGKFVNRHTYPISIDADKFPPELKAAGTIKGIFDKVFGQRDSVPSILALPGASSVYYHQFSGNGWTPDRMEQQIMDGLTKHHAMNKAVENMINKQVEALEKNLEKKANWATAGKIYNQIMSQPGYAPARDLAIDAMEKAEADGAAELREAFSQAKSDEYAEAKKLATKVQTDYKNLPLADEAKAHLAALKLLEAANASIAKEKKADAIKSLDSIVNTYGDTPYAAIAIARKKDLAPAKK